MGYYDDEVVTSRDDNERNDFSMVGQHKALSALGILIGIGFSVVTFLSLRSFARPTLSFPSAPVVFNGHGIASFDADQGQTYSQAQHTKASTITGCHEGVDVLTGERPARQEFDEFERAGPAFDLYIQCQAQLMATDQSDISSYYQIAGLKAPLLYSFPAFLTRISRYPWKTIQILEPSEFKLVCLGRLLHPSQHPLSGLASTVSRFIRGQSRK